MAITSIEILTQPEHGHVSVNPDNTLAFVATRTDFTGIVTFSYRVFDDVEPTQDKTKTVLIQPSPQEGGWGTSENHYMLEVDPSTGRVIVEPGKIHRKIYISPTGLTQADISALEGIATATFIADSTYGTTEETALAPDIGSEVHKFLVERPADKRTSHWLLLERGSIYDLTWGILQRDTKGESELHPLYIGAWGVGDAPQVTQFVRLANGVNENVVMEDIHFIGGLQVLEGHKNLLFNNITFSSNTAAFQGSDSITVRNTIFYDIFKDTVVDNDGDGFWDPHPARSTGLYVAGNTGLLIEGTVIDQCGWATDFAPDGSITGGHPPSMFSHNIYIQNSARDVTFRNSITMRGASFGAHTRRGAYIEDVLFLDNNVAWDVLGGDYQGAGPIGYYSLVHGTVTTVSARRGSGLPDIGAINWGNRNDGLLTSLIDNIVTHANDPDDPNDTVMSESAMTHSKGEDGVFVDNTKIWRWGMGQNGIDGTEANVAELDTAIMNTTTIQRYTANLLNQATATVDDFGQYLRGLVGTNYAGAARDVLSYFRAGFGITETDRTTAATLRFIPGDNRDGVRWDNRLNWDSGDLPGTVAGDSVDLGGNEVVFGGTVSPVNLTFGKFGGLIVNHGKLEVTGALSVSESCTLEIGNSGQVWLSGTFTGTDDFAVTVTSGRFANTAAYDLPGAVTVTGDKTQAILATAGGSFTVDTLTVDALSKVGFDDSATGTATLTFATTSTLTCLVDDADTFRPIGKFRSGAYGDDNSGLSTTAALDGTLIVDLANYTGGAGKTLTLLDVDTLTGTFATTNVINVPDGLTASITENATTVTLTIS